VTLPAAGWFPDPRDAGRLRWWDGRAWGEATRVLPQLQVEPVVPILVTPTGPSFSVHTSPVEHRAWAYGASTSRRVCPFAISALLFAITSIALNPFGVFSVLAVAAGVIGVAHPGATGRWRVLARSLASSALVVAIATAIIAAVALIEHAVT